MGEDREARLLAHVEGSFGDGRTVGVPPRVASVTVMDDNGEPGAMTAER